MFCFTPKGRLIALPRGANPIDFAYAVHTDIGNTCVGAKINGRPMPLVTELRNGDEVEIICSKAQLPPSAWQSLAVTGKARSAIRRATRDAVRAQYGKLGREILVRAFQRREKIFSEDSLTAALGRLSQKTAEDVMAAVGRGELGSADVVRAVFPEDKLPEPPKRRRKVKRNDEGWFGLGKVMGLKFRWPGSGERPREHGPSGIPIRGLRGDLPVSFADGGAGAGRPHRRHPHAGRGHHHLSDPRRGAEGLRRGARALDRRDLGHRRGQSAALPGQDHRHRPERARAASRRSPP